MKTLSLLFTSFIAGFLGAFITAGVHSIFFVLLPITAFVFGYFSSWRRGLFCGFLLFWGYTFATALMWEVRWAFIGFSQYLGAFIFGGFSIVLVGVLAPLFRKGFRNPGAIVTFVILVGVIAWCSYISVPHYRYDYQVNILCSEDMELHLPVAEASDKLSVKLLDQSFTKAGNYEADCYSFELVETEYGQMIKLNMYGRITPEPERSGRSSNWCYGSKEILSWPGHSPAGMIQLAPKFDTIVIDRVEPSALSWPPVITQGRVLNKFSVPIKVKTGVEAEFGLHVSIIIDRISGINFGYTKTETYVESIEWLNGSTSEQWIMVPAEARTILSVRGIGD